MELFYLVNRIAALFSQIQLSKYFSARHCVKHCTHNRKQTQKDFVQELSQLVLNSFSEHIDLYFLSQTKNTNSFYIQISSMRTYVNTNNDNDIFENLICAMYRDKYFISLITFDPHKHIVTFQILWILILQLLGK